MYKWTKVDFNSIPIRNIKIWRFLVNRFLLGYDNSADFQSLIILKHELNALYLLNNDKNWDNFQATKV